MARNIYQRLNNLKARRSGTDRLSAVRADSASELLTKSIFTEDYLKRSAADKPNTRYTLGSMQEVSPDYTRISIETAQRVGNQLEQGLTRAGFSVEFRLQGSVPLNTHIRGVSDVDLLNLDKSHLTYMVGGARAQAGWYTSPTSRYFSRSTFGPAPGERAHLARRLSGGCRRHFGRESDSSVRWIAGATRRCRALTLGRHDCLPEFRSGA